MKRDERAERSARAANRVMMDRAEYLALVELRDGAHENLKLAHMRQTAQYQELIEINQKQIQVICKQQLEVDHARQAMKKNDERDALLVNRVAKLEHELIEANKRLETAYPSFSSKQPAIGK